ncbi:unnamed protein product, partial [Clonostachys rhizophaga]
MPAPTSANGPSSALRASGQTRRYRPMATLPPGFVIYMQRKLFHWSQKWNPNYKEYVEEKQATADDDGKPVASDRMLEELSNDKYGIGWGAQLHIKHYPNAKPIAIAQSNSGPYFQFSPRTVSDRNYPLVRDAYIYLNRVPGQPVDPKTREFLRFVLSKQAEVSAV